jgi:hypothetical protein
VLLLGSGRGEASDGGIVNDALVNGLPRSPIMIMKVGYSERRNILTEYIVVLDQVLPTSLDYCPGHSNYLPLG